MVCVGGEAVGGCVAGGGWLACGGCVACGGCAAGGGWLACGGCVAGGGWLACGGCVAGGGCVVGGGWVDCDGDAAGDWPPTTERVMQMRPSKSVAFRSIFLFCVLGVFFLVFWNTRVETEE